MEPADKNRVDDERHTSFPRRRERNFDDGEPLCKVSSGNYRQNAVNHGAMTISASKGKLVFALMEPIEGPMKVRLLHGSRAYARWTGSGTVSITNDVGPPTIPDILYETSYNLKLKP